MANFDIPYVSTSAWFSEETFPLGDGDDLENRLPGNLYFHLGEIDTNSVFLSENLGSIFIFIMLTFVGLILIVFTMGCRKINVIGKVNNKL